MRKILLLLICVAIAGLTAHAGPGARVAVPAFKKAFAPGMTVFTRRSALEKLAEVPEAPILKAFDWALNVTRGEVKRRILEKDDAVKEVKRLQKQVDDLMLAESERARKDGRPPRPVSIPVTLAQSINQTRRKVDGLVQRIDEEYQLRGLAAEALGAWISTLPGDELKPVLKDIARKGLSDRDWTVRSFYVSALGDASVPPATRLLLERLSEEKDRRVLPAVIDAVARQAGAMAVTDLLPHLADERWQIRAAVISALADIGSHRAIEPLIERLDVETGRLRGDLAAALKKLTGQDLGISAERWRTWWEKNRDRLTKPEDGPDAKPPDEGGDAPGGDAAGADGGPGPGGEKVSFYGIEIVSKRVIFVIDVSNSMNQAASTKNQNRSKVEVARYELKTALLGLPEDGAFNIVFYHHEVFQWRKGMVKAGGKAKRAAVKFVEAMVADGNTNIYDALERAFNIVGMGAHDKNYETGADVILFLSDGQPNRGAVTDPGQILNQVKRWNQLRRVKIHTVGVGPSHDSAFMKALADFSGGKYVKR